MCGADKADLRAGKQFAVASGHEENCFAEQEEGAVNSSCQLSFRYCLVSNELILFSDAATSGESFIRNME